MLIRKDDVDRARTHQVEELVTVAVDAERVGQRHRHLATRLVGETRGHPDRFLGARRVPQIALEIGDLRTGRLILLDILGSEFDAGAEIGVHRALAVRRHEDHRARRRRLGVQWSRVEGDALGADVVRVDLAEMVVRDLAEEGRASAKACDARCRVARRSAGCLDRRAHAAIEQLGPFAVDQVHRSLDDLVLAQEIVVAPGNDIDDRIADAQNVIIAHAGPRVAAARAAVDWVLA